MFVSLMLSLTYQCHFCSILPLAVASASIPTTTMATVREPLGDPSNQKCRDIKINMTTDGEYYSFKVREGQGGRREESGEAKREHRR